MRRPSAFASLPRALPSRVARAGSHAAANAMLAGNAVERCQRTPTGPSVIFSAGIPSRATGRDSKPVPLSMEIFSSSVICRRMSWIFFSASCPSWARAKEKPIRRIREEPKSARKNFFMGDSFHVEVTHKHIFRARGPGIDGDSAGRRERTDEESSQEDPSMPWTHAMKTKREERRSPMFAIDELRLIDVSTALTSFSAAHSR